MINLRPWVIGGLFIFGISTCLHGCATNRYIHIEIIEGDGSFSMNPLGFKADLDCKSLTINKATSDVTQSGDVAGRVFNSTGQNVIYYRDVSCSTSEYKYLVPYATTEIRY